MKKLVVCILLILVVVGAVACQKEPYTQTIPFEKQGAKVIAHRGLSGLEVENTNSAFVRAGEHSYYGIETDVRRTADGKFIICHDETLTRISGQEIVVEEHTFDELINIPLYDKNTQTVGAERLSDLDSYLKICKQYGKHAILELKSNFTQEEIASMISIINDSGYLEHLTFISFGYDNLTYVRNILPDQPVQYLFSKLTDDIATKLINNKIDVAIYHKALTKKALEQFHNAGLEVNCWTVDDIAVAEQLAKWGVDYITTNILE